MGGAPAPAAPVTPSAGPPASERWLVAGALAVYLTLVLRVAWVTDDAFISLRTVDNFLHGYGLRWNVSERVQVYTHPLWLFCLIVANALWHDPFYSTLALSVCTSAAAMVVLGFGVGRTSVQAALAVALLALSRGFVDFSTSGLENPLSHLLLGAFAWLYFAGARVPPVFERHRTLTLAALAALVALNRQDTVLLVLPALAEVAWRSLRDRGARATLRDLALGFAPLFAWLCFSLFYYGFPFPNTAYAKLSTGVAGSTLRAQGIVYLLNTIAWDPALAALLVLGLSLGFSSADARQRWLALGSLLYLVYVVNVGGDFMAGRFLTAPAFVLGCVLAARPAFFERPAHALALGLPFLLFYLVEAGTETWPVVGDLKISGVVDERSVYRKHGSLMLATRDKQMPDHPWAHEGVRLARRGVKVQELGTAGYRGYFAGPSVYFIDHYALTDPFLSHLRASNTEGFRIGHFRRSLPRGYKATIASGECVMSRNFCRYYAELGLLTQGKLLSGARLVAILRMNLGLDDALLGKASPDEEAPPRPSRLHPEVGNEQAEKKQAKTGSGTGDDSLDDDADSKGDDSSDEASPK
jgi:arabinofuranosyltransferase